jgi:hypothetical protein
MARGGTLAGVIDLGHAGMGLGGFDVKRDDTAARDGAHSHHRVEHARRMIVRCITGGTRHLSHAVTAGHRLAGIGTMTKMGLGIESHVCRSSSKIDNKGRVGGTQMRQP